MLVVVLVLGLLLAGTFTGPTQRWLYEGGTEHATRVMSTGAFAACVAAWNAPANRSAQREVARDWPERTYYANRATVEYQADGAGCQVVAEQSFRRHRGDCAATFARSSHGTFADADRSHDWPDRSNVFLEDGGLLDPVDSPAGFARVGDTSSRFLFFNIC